VSSLEVGTCVRIENRLLEQNASRADRITEISTDVPRTRSRLRHRRLTVDSVPRWCIRTPNRRGALTTSNRAPIRASRFCPSNPGYGINGTASARAVPSVQAPRPSPSLPRARLAPPSPLANLLQASSTRARPASMAMRLLPPSTPPPLFPSPGPKAPASVSAPSFSYFSVRLRRARAASAAAGAAAAGGSDRDGGRFEGEARALDPAARQP